MHVHLIAVAGTGMGALAGLFKELGHDVSGSDVRFDPPMGPALEKWGIRLMQGFDPAHLDPAPDLVGIGNVCRSNNPEARAAIDRGLPYTDMAHGLADLVLEAKTPVVIAGTHGKTTTSSLAAWLLFDAGKDPGMLIGGLPKNFEHSFRIPSRKGPGLPLADHPMPTRRTPFVIEGDEYDTAFFEKTPKFWHYRPEIAVITSIEYDHIDIYPTFEAYLHAFATFVERIPSSGLLVASAASQTVVDVVSQHARCEVIWYALQGENWHGCTPHYLGALAGADATGQAFDLFIGGVASGRFALPMPGSYNVSNAIAAAAVAMQGFGVSVHQVRESLTRFQGVRRRQDLVGTPNRINIYDDFAHHPTAVEETLRGLRARHPQGSLFAVFEPRSATACRALHQDAYAQAFTAASHVVIAPLGRPDIAQSERLDVPRIIDELQRQGQWARHPESIDEIIDLLVREARPGDTIALLSNGAFGGIHNRLIQALSR
jgi:UDP-N-acetylmuramate: L-alanyl-gamma-D-glutamyl-meso-diaminopimelate ligase